jgi:hypothetical protein
MLAVVYTIDELPQYNHSDKFAYDSAIVSMAILESKVLATHL